jgi:hypothetical protein
MKVGRKIYYEKSTGNVLVNTGERQGAVIETTIDQDFEMYENLAGRVKESIGIIQLEYGYESDNFAKYPFRIDTATQTIIWNVDAPYGASLEEVKALKIQQMNEICQQEITKGFTSAAYDGVAPLLYDSKITDQSRINGLVAIAQLRLMGLSAEPIKWKNTNQAVCEEWQPEQMLQLGLDLKRHIEAKIETYDNLKVYIGGLEDIEAVNNVSWGEVI